MASTTVAPQLADPEKVLDPERPSMPADLAAQKPNEETEKQENVESSNQPNNKNSNEPEKPEVPERPDFSTLPKELQQIFEKHGKNLHEGQKWALKIIFDDMVESTHDGMFGTIELDKMVRLLGTEPTSNDLKQILDEFGSRAGKMDLAAFIDMMERQIISRQRDEFDILNPKFLEFLCDSFHLYDKDKDGSITKKEIQTVITLAGEKADDTEIDEIFFLGDRNNDGIVDFDEWVALMADMEHHFKDFSS